MEKLKSFLGKRNDFPDLFRHLILSWLLSVGIEYFMLPRRLRDLAGLEGLAQMSLGRVIGFTICFVLLLCMVSCFANLARIERAGMILIVGLLAAGSIGVSVTEAYLAVCILILAVLLVYGIFGWREDLASKGYKPACIWIIIVLSAAFFLFVSVWTVSRVYSFSTPTFDFGIFAQMFYHMKESLMPLTTVERDGLLSHFAVHVSPIYYLLLPFYWLFPIPAALQVLQAAVVTSAVIPLWKIGKHHGLTEVERTLLCGMLLFFPAFSGGTSYDIHENCFLTPLILWTLYGIDRKNTAITAFAAILTLMVKEDAAVYVAVIGLWLIVKTLLKAKELDQKNLMTGLTLLALSVGWFFLVTTYLAKSGDGVMTYRYSNFMYDGSSSLITVIKAIILNPMKVVYECVDPEKLKFIGMTITPLLGIPLITRRYERYILLIPYILINLMSDYTYQHDIFFQYTFGSTAFLFYLTLINIADMKINWKKLAVLITATVVSAVFFCTTILPVGLRYPIRAVQYYDHYESIRGVLDTIPEDASVTATTFYTTYLSQRELLYDVRYCSEEHLLETDYVVLSVNSNSDCSKYATEGMNNGYENLVYMLEERGYEKYEELDGVLVVFEK